MRYMSVVFLMLLAACARETLSRDAHSSSNAMSFAQAQGHVFDVWEILAPRARAMCREVHDDPTSCAFDVALTARPSLGANARSWQNEDGRAQIEVSLALIRLMGSEEELAFVLAHEAAHGIAGHHAAVGIRHLRAGFHLGQTDGRRMELEADAIGALLAARSGYDPMAGAALLSRIHGDKDDPSDHSHPSVADRLRVIERSWQAVQAGAEISLD